MLAVMYHLRLTEIDNYNGLWWEIADNTCKLSVWIRLRLLNFDESVSCLFQVDGGLIYMFRAELNRHIIATNCSEQQRMVQIDNLKLVYTSIHLLLIIVCKYLLRIFKALNH